MSIEYIFKRRSIRKYLKKDVETEKIELILKAGMSAPSAHNIRPWQFIVIKKRNTLDKIAEFHPHGKMLSQSPMAIAVCGEHEKSTDFWVQDCAAATENMLLSLPALGLGGVWIGVYPNHHENKEILDLIGIPKHITLFSIISIGYPDEEKPPKALYEESKIHYEKW
ncbi:MAG: nitroreductase family protein [Candidatus Marinimicrobia bacterium]|nr:nitroreductase family protein [Candidatus Neomarinimicrobiota bacterium]